MPALRVAAAALRIDGLELAAYHAHLDELDVFLEYIVDQLGEVYSLGFRLGGEVILYPLVEINRQPKHCIGLIELAALSLAEIVMVFHSFAF